MGAVTIRVPDDLKERMNKHGKVNWSDVARTAFEEAITREERKQAIEKITALLETDDDKWDGVEEIRRWREHPQ